MLTKQLLQAFIAEHPLHPFQERDLIAQGLIVFDEKGNKVVSEAGHRLLNSAPEPDPSALDRQVGGSHYRNFAIQPVEFIERNALSFLEGSVIKRICRHGAKGKAEDLRKAIHEIELLIELHYGRV